MACTGTRWERAAVSLASDPLHEERLSADQVFDGVLLKVWRDVACLPDGKHRVREYVRHPGAVVVAAIDEKSALVFERQFRYPLQRTFLELPAGKIDAGEDVLACARRELREETGHVAAEWHHVGVIHPCIGYSDERIEVFFARGLTRVERALDDGEFLEVLSLTPDEVERDIRAGVITDAKTIAAYYLALPLIHASTGG